MKQFFSVWLFGLFFVPFLAAQALSPYSFHYFKDYPKVLHLIESTYLTKNLPQDLVQKSLQNMLWSIDVRYNLATEPISNDWQYQLLMTWGICLNQLQGTPQVGQVWPDSPAAFSGLKKGDLLIEIDEQPTDSWNDYQIAKRFLGKSFIQLKIQKPISLNSEPKILQLKRGDLPWRIPGLICHEAKWDILETTMLTSSQFPELSRISPKILLVDLRCCYLESDSELSKWISFFLPNCEGLKKTSRSGLREILTATESSTVPFSGILILEIDANTHGLTEVFARAATQHGALIIGTASAGFPYQTKWLKLDAQFEIEMAFWSYQCLEMDIPFSGPIEPNINAWKDQVIPSEVKEVILKIP